MKKKILIVASTSEHLKNFHLPYIEELKKDYAVYTMSRDIGEPFSDFNIEFEKKLFTFRHFKIIKQIREILLKENFDAVFLNTSLAAFLVRVALKKIKNKPVVVNIVHGYLFSKKLNPFKKLWFLSAEKIVRKQTDYVVVMNEEDYVIATKNKLFTKNIFKINGMGIRSERFNKSLKEQNKSGDVSFAFIGELSNRKNQIFLIKFVKELNKFNIHSSLKLVGDGLNHKKLQKFITKKCLESQVELVGYDPNVEQYIASCNYYICSSKIEGMPFNILEAMYCGAVVFSSNIKGTIDVIEDLENGILFKLGNMNNFVNKFRLVNNNLTLQEKIRKNAKTTAKKYLLSSVLNENISLFKALIENGGNNSENSKNL